MNYIAIKQAIEIADEIKKLKLATIDKEVDQVVEKENWDLLIQPRLELFNSTFNKNPSNILQEFLHDYLSFNQHRLKLKFSVKQIGFTFYRFKKYCWACIYLVDEKNPTIAYKRSPQLTMNIDDLGVKCAFTYCVQVNNDSNPVKIFRENI
ncbi:hypothetical protein D9V86_11280 [Bacteroidetes/Chlorobi group bacterium ChocPot_Mid]|nr:MAG: hypothetical protein D9V86_11280 [Bacteroidetes/Chlorobi group bacterium ChocPot_Mid]